MAQDAGLIGRIRGWFSSKDTDVADQAGVLSEGGDGGLIPEDDDGGLGVGDDGGFVQDDDAANEPATLEGSGSPRIDPDVSGGLGLDPNTSTDSDPSAGLDLDLQAAPAFDLPLPDPPPEGDFAFGTGAVGDLTVDLEQSSYTNATDLGFDAELVVQPGPALPVDPPAPTPEAPIGEPEDFNDVGVEPATAEQPDPIE